MANAIKGQDFALLVQVDGQLTAVCYAKETTLNLEHEVIETTTKQGNKFRKYTYKRAGYSLSVNGNLNAVPGNGTYFQQALLNGDTIYWTFTDAINFQWSGEVLVTNASFDSPLDALSSFSNELLGNGEPTYVLLPTANIDPDQTGYDGGGEVVTQFVTVKDQTGATVALVPAPGIYTVTRFNQIGGGSSTPRSPSLIITPYN